MIEELKVLYQISQCKGKGSQKEAQEVLAQNLTDKMKYMLEIAFNPFITTKLNKVEVYEQSSTLSSPLFTDSNGEIYNNFVGLIEELKTVKAANNELRERATNLVNSLYAEARYRQLLADIITKNLNIGIQAKSINKAAGYNLIPDPSLMLAREKEGVIETWPEIHCEVKYDGVRMIAVVESGDVKFFTRNFNELDATKLSRIKQGIIKLVNGNLFANLFFDGELTDLNRKSVSGKLNKILKGTAPSDIDKDFMFNIFDVENIKALESKGTVPYLQRRRELELHFDNVNVGKHLTLAEAWNVKNKKELLEKYDSIVAGGGEGVIAKHPDHIYECKRSDNWIKFKQINECDLKIIGTLDGKKNSKREGYIGALCCTDSTNTLKVDVGSGFTDQELEVVTKMRDSDELIGKIVTIKYNERITDKHDNESLFLPRFVEIRNDKTQPNNINEIK